MSVSIEKKEKNSAVLTVTVPAEEFEKAIEQAYQKEKNKIQLPGFRRGRAPRRMIEKMYGKGVFYEEAANIAIQNTYDAAAKECGEKIVSRPEIDITQIEAGKDLIYTAAVALKPEVTLGVYKGVEIAREEVSVTEDEINAEIEKQRDENSRMVDVDNRAVEKDDHVKLDFDGSVDGKTFDGGKAENYELVIGSGSFIPGFEDQIIGRKTGEEFDVNVTFPDDYHAENLKGKAAVFKCRVNAIQVKELPELNDDFAQDVSEFDTLGEYKASVETKLREKKETEAKNRKENAAVTAAVENAQIDIPDAMVEEQARRMLNEFSQKIQSQGLSMEQYMQFTGMDNQKLVEQMKPQAIVRIKNSLVLEAVAKAENIGISDERLDEELTKMAEQYKMEKDKLAEVISDEGKRQMKDDLAIQEAARLITENAVEVDKPAENAGDNGAGETADQQ